MAVAAAVWAVAFCFIVNTGVVHASVGGARGAVERKLDARGFRGTYDITCERESRTRYYCEWNAMTRADVREGRTEGTDGIATVTQYRGRYVARVY